MVTEANSGRVVMATERVGAKKGTIMKLQPHHVSTHTHTHMQSETEDVGEHVNAIWCLLMRDGVEGGAHV